MNRDKDFKDFVLREYRERGILKNEFKTFDEIKKKILHHWFGAVSRLYFPLTFIFLGEAVPGGSGAAIPIIN